MSSADVIELSILLPVRDEGPSLRVMLRILSVMVDVSHEVVIVHDDPDDRSLPVVRALQPHYPNVRTVHNTLGRGVINALKAGVASARGKYVLIFAADEVGPVLAIEDMLALMRNGCDLVSCTRYAHGGRRLGGSVLGGVLSRLANRMFRWLTGCILTDATTGIKLFQRTRFDELNLSARPVGWAVAFEIAIKAQLLGWRLGEVPIVSIDRLYGGESTFRPGPWIVEYLRWFCWGVAALHQKGRAQSAVMVQIPATTALGAKAVP